MSADLLVQVVEINTFIGFPTGEADREAPEEARHTIKQGEDRIEPPCEQPTEAHAERHQAASDKDAVYKDKASPPFQADLAPS